MTDLNNLKIKQKIINTGRTGGEFEVKPNTQLTNMEEKSIKSI